MQSHTIRRLACAASIALATSGIAARAAGIDVSPPFAAYGQSVDAQLQGIGAVPYIPATRYHREGAVISIEQEHMRGGYFGFRSDMGVVPISLGELEPGQYTIQARLWDMASPDDAPWLFTQFVDVAPPDGEGVYPVPRVPGAYDEVKLVVRADGPVDASSMRASVEAGIVRVDFDYSLDESKPSFATMKLAGLAPGAWRVEAHGHNPGIASPGRQFNGAFMVDTASAVVEYYSDKLGHYFVTAWPDEIAILDAGTAFERTGERFKAWLHASDAPASAVPVCRFYASGPNSHFYTADPGECQYIKSLQQKQAADASAKGQPFQGWQFEAIAFYALAPENGTCPANTRPVWRAYNDRAAENDSNHRFMVTDAVRLAMKMGWADEGLAFCAPA
jgi:hypothetical protein